MIKGSILVLLASVAVVASPAPMGRPRIMTSGLCGVVTDLSGMPVKKATVTAMFGDSSSSQDTDEAGHWSFGSGTGPRWIEVEGAGYQTIQFDYVDKDHPKSNGADNPAFLTKPADGACLTPIYVRLAPMNHKAGFVSLDASKGIHKEKKSK
jgi:hypothetical protein